MKNVHLAAEKKVLFTASITEFGERYSYYVIQSLLIFFLIERFGISNAQSSTLVGTVLSVIYISAIVGGYIADKLINHYVAAFIGSGLMILGSIILAISASQNGLYFGLAFIAISTGLIKSNISAFIGEFYDKSRLSEGHRDFGFSVFYVGINLGSFFALFCASYFKEHYGYFAPFYTSIFMTAVMCINLIVGFFNLKQYMTPINFNAKLVSKLIMVIVAYIILVYIILKNPTIANITIFVAIALCLFILFKSAGSKYWKNVGLATLFFTLSILYWALYFQIFISLLLFVEKVVTHKFLFFSINSSQFLSVESLAVLILGGIMGRVWLNFSNKGKPVHDIDKFNFAFLVMTIMFIFFYFSIYFSSSNAKVPAIIFIFGYIILAISELSLSAIGLSLVTKIAPRGFVALYMGIWLVTLGIGGKIAGILSAHINITDTIADSKISMEHGLLIFVLLSIIGSLACFLLQKKIKLMDIGRNNQGDLQYPSDLLS